MFFANFFWIFSYLEIFALILGNMLICPNIIKLNYFINPL